MFLSDMEHFKNDAVEVLYIYKMTHYWPTHSHPGEYQILLVFDGELEIIIQDETMFLGPDEYLVIPPTCMHSERSSIPLRVLALVVKEEALQDDAASVLDLIDTIVERLQKKGLIEVDHIISLSKAASSALNLFRKSTDECSEFVAKAREILEKWPEKHISTEEMADVVNTCREHLSRVFKKQVGMTPHQYQLQNRVRKASWMLVDTEVSIADIGKECGFYDKSHFEKQFKRQLGMTPFQYRNAFRQASQLMS